MKVIKLGGSLSKDPIILKQCLQTIAQYKNKVVIVSGGGTFADLVRSTQKQWAFDNKIAHQMALLAMQQTALLLKSLSPSFVLASTVLEIQQYWHDHPLVIWSPTLQELDNAGIKASWDVTSDSLSAWLANQLQVEELVLVKSAKIPLSSTIQQMQIQGLIDQAFHQFSNNASYQITFIDKYRFNEDPVI